ncbi:MAG: hypothetical protein IKI02_07255 [Oscillospiraceae bacterium]|nr:hypothetical protein [Oscillospiraceae bacterium]
MNALSGLENLLVILGIAGFFIAPIAWVVFIVSCFRAKNSYSESTRKRRRIIRTVSLIVAILFTILVLIFIFAMSNGEGGVPLPTNLS